MSGVTIVGSVPEGLPEIAIPPFDLALWTSLAVPALLIAILGYVESISVAMTLAAKRRQRVDPDQEMIGLGAANVGSALSGGFPVTGGLSRSVVNFDAGAETPAAGAYTAIGIALTALFLNATAVLPAKSSSWCHCYCSGFITGGRGGTQTHLCIFQSRFCSDGSHDPGYLDKRNRGGSYCWCRSLHLSAPL